MIQLRKFALSALFVLAGATSLTAADWWVRPATTPNTDVKCNICVDRNKDQLTPGYPSTIKTYVGRYLDSQPVIDWQAPFRTARARNVVVMPSLNRLYFIIGSSVMSYDMNKFFTRLTGHESLVDVTNIPVLWDQYSRNQYHEQFLPFDGFFYPESGSSGWDTPRTDGQERLYGIDADNQGYVYLATRFFGWGIIKDDLTGNGGLTPVSQTLSTASSDVVPFLIASLKGSNGVYYAIVSDTSSSTLNVYDVTDRANPQKKVNLPKSMYRFAKNSTSTVVGLSTVDGRFEIYTTDALVANGPPLLSASGADGGSIRGVACDGSNFYVASDASGGLVITTYAPNVSGGYSKVADFRTTRASLATGRLTYGDGFLVQTGFTDGSYELRLFKAPSATDVSEVDLSIPAAPGSSVKPYYFKNYYINNNSGRSGYVAGGLFCLFYDSAVVKRNGHTYLIVTGYGLGDVYELSGSDSITISTSGSVGTANPNRPAGGSAGPFYGDPVGFTATTTAAAPVNINWDFGNPESATIAADPNSGPGVTGQAISHRYSGLFTASSLPTTRTVQATSISNPNVNGAIPVTLAKPSVSIGLLGRTGTVTLPSQLASIPIIAGDKFIDTSDGSVQSHFDSWTIDTATTKTLPSESLSVGNCAAQHTLTMTAHYGPYTGASPNESSLSDMPIAISNAVYSVRPFAASITTTPGASNVDFAASVRVTGDTSVFTAAQSAALQYRWQLLDASNNVIVAGPTGSSQIPTFSVPKTAFTSRGIRARLTLTSPTPAGGSCANLGMETYDAYTQPLNGPDPVIDGGCSVPDNGPPCSFGVHSASGVDPTADGWAYTWSLQPANFKGAATDGATFKPIFTATGTYTLNVLVTNGIGSSTATMQVKVDKILPICDTMLPGNNVFIAYAGPISACSHGGGTCVPNEQITFSAAAFAYNFACDTHTFSWSFGDGALGTGQSPKHAFGANGIYPVSVTIANSAQSVTMSVNVLVGVVPHGCKSMVPNQNVFPTYSASSGCNNNSSSIPCNLGETVLFGAAGSGYDFSCATHTFTWDFGDGSNAATSALSQTHAYTKTGTYTASLSISNGTQTVTGMTMVVRVGTLKDCPDIVPGNNVFIVYSGPKSQCSVTTSTNCSNDEDIVFNAAALNYSFACATHTFMWDFGDGSAPVPAPLPAANLTHRYPAGGIYTVKLTVTITHGDGTTTNVIVPQAIKVDEGTGTTTCNVDFSVDQRVVGGVVLPNEYVFTVTGLNGGPLPSPAPASYTWDFGDHTTVTTSSPTQTHPYADGNVYTVTLTAQGTNCRITHPNVKPKRHAAGR